MTLTPFSIQRRPKMRRKYFEIRQHLKSETETCRRIMSLMIQFYCCQVTSDAVGFGFVLRGNCPTYVQAVDPMGPAAMAGLKVI